jgi:hypothetical protein
MGGLKGSFKLPLKRGNSLLAGSETMLAGRIYFQIFRHFLLL